ncbi:hypothetical protein GPOL_c37580 [Gordonia polyisoprenivorans VH2]|uniref:Uncharacterized protein n=3 Tax=Gordonia polyisoprenivorans TaxID=84595 RepID=H6N3U7_GORPV|nr:hypothetical protein GPOL_c37580 [Gordonia polyisoprenivorans VH2]NKY03328.1 hypothetical protein [Gordonia polyisoprenivorans]QUD83878.1 hypothetical protein J8M97_04320 [Gordonia polyisoprenivorans]GAB21816.1 hypothetical protein GOPIP_011_02080 [Gordonia polyisoprenivorans NBRC 16320 = JCM 10675]HCS58845.1 hypothetical protein [Gordonia polyisoprenivorans]
MFDFMECETRTRRAFLGGNAILEAYDVEEVIVLPALRMLVCDNGTDASSSAPWELDESARTQVRASIARHLRTSDVLAGMLRDALGGRHLDGRRLDGRQLDDRSPVDRGASNPLRGVAGALPVRAQGFLLSDAAKGDDAARSDLVRLAFLLVAAHALSDPTDVATASRSLNLVPPPLHRDRAMMNTVLAQVVPALTSPRRAWFEITVSKAASFFSVPDEKRLPAVGDRLAPGTSDLTLLRYNRHSLALACEQVGLRLLGSV